MLAYYDRFRRFGLKCFCSQLLCEVSMLLGSVPSTEEGQDKRQGDILSIIKINELQHVVPRRHVRTAAPKRAKRGKRGKATRSHGATVAPRATWSWDVRGPGGCAG